MLSEIQDVMQSSTSQVNPETESTNLVDVPQSEKSKRIERKYQRAVEEGVASVFGIDRKNIREDIRPILEEISAEVKNGNKISDEQIEKLSRYWVARYAAYPVMWTTAQETDDDYYGTVKPDENPWLIKRKSGHLPQRPCSNQGRFGLLWI